ASHTANAVSEQSPAPKRGLADGLGAIADTGVAGAFRRALLEWFNPEERSALGTISPASATPAANTPGWRRLGPLAADRATCIFAKVALETAASGRLKAYADKLRHLCKLRSNFGLDHEAASTLKRAADAAEEAVQQPELTKDDQARVRAAASAA